MNEVSLPVSRAVQHYRAT